MENIFIDTSVYEEGQFVGSGILKTLFESAREGRICILLPEITEREVVAHIHSKVKEEHDRLKRLSSSILKHIGDLKEKLEDAAKASESSAEDLEKAFEDQLDKAKVCKIPIQKDLDLQSIVDAYFRKEPPFSQKKKAEFPDAIVLKSLEQWCEENKTNCIVLARDGDMHGYHCKYLNPRKLEDYMEELTKRIREERQKEEEIRRISLNAYHNLIADRLISDTIKNWIYDQMYDDTLYCEALQIEDINDYSIGEPQIDFSRPSKPMGIYKGHLAHKVEVTVSTEIAVNHPDYDTAYYDGEDRQWYFIDDAKITSLTSILEFDLDFITDENGENTEIDTINSGRRLTRSEMVNSMADSR